MLLSTKGREQVAAAAYCTAIYVTACSDADAATREATLKSTKAFVTKMRTAVPPELVADMNSTMKKSMQR